MSFNRKKCKTCCPIYRIPTTPGIDSRSPYVIANHYLVDLFKHRGHTLHKKISLPTHSFAMKDENPIADPLASIDKGYSKVDCTTDLSALEPEQVAKMILNVNDHATNFFIQQIRRWLSVLGTSFDNSKRRWERVISIPTSIQNMHKCLSPF